MTAAEIMQMLFGWWTGSAIQVGIIVSAFWLFLIVAIMAIVSANQMGGES
jgi:hypothetical protein